MHCLDMTKGVASAIVASINLPGSETLKERKYDVTRQSLRTLRLQWMYGNADFLWLTDEVHV